ncbi:hypothetical protein OTSSIDO_0360 [Orientia tsutsugamushi str. Sido]|nr:hypothetical protein OTSSIDO_0360 [Orientia tsutsugamushi str. Sido]
MAPGGILKLKSCSKTRELKLLDILFPSITKSPRRGPFGIIICAGPTFFSFC